MKVTLLGTGCPQCDPDRLGPASLVQHGGRHLLIDAGSGATQRLVSAGSSGRALDAVLLTHLHSDHIVDLFQLVISSWHQGRDRPQRIYGPAGTQWFVDGLMALWRPELEQRIAHERRPSMAGLEVEVTEIGAGEVMRLDDISVRAVAVDHFPVKHAFGFVIEAGGRRVAFSGDTAPCPALVATARDADLLVHECFIHGIMRPEPGVRTQEGLDNVARYHTASTEIGRIAAEARVRSLLLNHFVSTKFDKEAVLADVRRDYRGPALIGEDLMSVDLVTGVVAYAGAVIGLGL
ncbi:MAG: MBL fold metallo-hydrolase [Stellaceae bacterium]